MRQGPALLGLQKYARQQLRLGPYLDEPGDGRTLPQIPATALLWALIGSKFLRVHAFCGVEQLARTVRRAFGIPRAFADDTLGYFIERLDAERLRGALGTVVQRARRNKAFENVPRLGLALDGTGVGRSTARRCALCHEKKNAEHEVVGYGHKMVGASLLADALTLPLDVEFYRPGEGELTAGKRLLRRVVGSAGIRFDYLVVDGLYPGAPFLHLANELKLPVVARLTEKLPELFGLAQRRFQDEPPAHCFTHRGERVEIWDADFEPWEGLTWSDVRVIRYRQTREDGKIYQAEWLTNFSRHRLPARSLYQMCKSRWQIENRFFNEAKNLYGLEHIAHHHANAVVIDTLLTCLAICIERLYRLRHLHRGKRPVYSAVELARLLWIALGAPIPPDTS